MAARTREESCEFSILNVPDTPAFSASVTAEDEVRTFGLIV